MIPSAPVVLLFLVLITPAWFLLIFCTNRSARNIICYTYFMITLQLLLAFCPTAQLLIDSYINPKIVMRKEWGRLWTDLLIGHLQISQCLRDGFELIQGDLKIEMYLMCCMKYISKIKYVLKDFTEELCSFFQTDNSSLNLICMVRFTWREFASGKCYNNLQN